MGSESNYSNHTCSNEGTHEKKKTGWKFSSNLSLTLLLIAVYLLLCFSISTPYDQTLDTDVVFPFMDISIVSWKLFKKSFNDTCVLWCGSQKLFKRSCYDDMCVNSHGSMELLRFEIYPHSGQNPLHFLVLPSGNVTVVDFICNLWKSVNEVQLC